MEKAEKHCKTLKFIMKMPHWERKQRNRPRATTTAN